MRTKFARVHREVDWDSSESIEDYFDSIGQDGEILGFPLESFSQCEFDEDCEEVARNCRIGCGNRPEILPNY